MIIFFLLLSIISLLEINFFFLFIYRQLYHLFVANLLNEIDLRRVFLFFFFLSFSFELHQLNFRFETETIHLFLTGAFDWQNVSTRKLTSIIIEILERADESIREDVLQNTRKNFFFIPVSVSLSFFFFVRWSKLENFSPSKRVALLERNENSTGESARGAFYLLKYSPGENKIKIEIDA